MDTTNKGCLTFILVVAVIILLGAAFSVDVYLGLAGLSVLIVTVILLKPGIFKSFVDFIRDKFRI